MGASQVSIAGYRKHIAVAACWVGLLAPAPGFSQGITLRGVGAMNAGFGGAGTAAPISASGALYLNPASMAGMESSEITFGVALALPTTEVSSSLGGLSGETGGEPGVSPVPDAAWVEKLEDSPWSVGLGIFGIGGFRVNYPASLSNPVLTPPPPLGLAAGSVFAETEVLQLVPALAYEVGDGWSLGFAPTLTMARVTADPFLFATPDDANGDGIPTYPSGRGNRWSWGAGFQVGVYYASECGWKWGAAFKSPQWFEAIRIQAEDEQGRPRTVRWNVDYPLNVSIGAAYDGLERWLFAVDLRYFDYANAEGFQEAGFDSTGALRGLGWSSLFAVAAGAQYEVLEGLQVRSGYSFSQNPISDSESGFNVASPVINQHYLHLGTSFRFSPRAILSIAYVHGFENEVRGPLQSPLGPVPGTSVVSRVSSDGLGMDITVKF